MSMPGKSMSRCAAINCSTQTKANAWRLVGLGAGLPGSGTGTRRRIVLGHLDAGEELACAGRIAQQDGEVEAAAGDLRERVGRIDGKRREDREDRVAEVGVRRLALRPGQLRVVEDGDPGLGEQRRGARRPSAVAWLRCSSRSSFSTSCNCSLGSKPSGLRSFTWASSLIVQTGDADHEELVDLAADEAEELHALQQRMARRLGLLQHATHEANRRDFSINVELRAREVPFARFDRACHLTRRPCTHMPLPDHPLPLTAAPVYRIPATSAPRISPSPRSFNTAPAR